jgi:hypothetical protein
MTLHCNNVNSGFVSKHFARLVGAPLVGAHHKGTHEGCPYETGLVAAKGRSARRPTGVAFREECSVLAANNRSPRYSLAEFCSQFAGPRKSNPALKSAV